METEYKLAGVFMDTHPHEAARLLEGLSLESVVVFLDEVPLEQAVKMIDLMDLSAATRCIETLHLERACEVVDALSLQTASVFCRRLNKQRLQTMIDLLPEAKRDALDLLLSFPEGTAGALMDPRVLTLHADMTVEDALAHVRTYPEQALYYLYVLSEERTLAGVLNLRELMLAPQDQHVGSVMHEDVDTLSVHADYRVILAHPAWSRVHALPVVDASITFVGVLRYETLRRIEADIESNREAGDMGMTATAIGELYRVGLSGLLLGAAPLKQDAST